MLIVSLYYANVLYKASLSARSELCLQSRPDPGRNDSAADRKSFVTSYCVAEKNCTLATTKQNKNWSVPVPFPPVTSATDSLWHGNE